MKVPHLQLIESLQKDLEAAISTTNELTDGLDETKLNTPEAEGKWSMLQCLKHLSIAGEIYTDNIESAFKNSSKVEEDYTFKSHWKGDMFTKMISPKADGAIKNTMKTMKSMDPVEHLNPAETIDEFIRIHKQLIAQLETSKAYNLNKIKVPTALGPLVKLRLGDAFRFIIGHVQRHMLQLQRVHAAVMAQAEK